MSIPKGHLQVELYDYSLTPHRDNRTGRVVTTRTLSIDDLIARVVAQRTDLNAATLKMAYDLLHHAALEEVVNGASVQFGLARHSIGVRGVFVGDQAQWNPDKHSLSVVSKPSVPLREAMQQITVHMRGRCNAGTIVNTITDLVSGAQNQRLTPGGVVVLEGVKIKVAGDAAETGIRLINQTTHATVAIEPAGVVSNSSSKVMFMVPAHLPSGHYHLCLCTQFSGTGRLLKSVSCYTHQALLTVG